MPQPFSSEHHRVEVQLLQVLARFLLILVRALGRKRDAALVEATDVRRQKPARVSATELQSRESIERAFKNQMRQRDRRFERISNHVGQKSIALESISELRNTLRVHEDQRAERLSLRPERIERRRGELFPVDR